MPTSAKPPDAGTPIIFTKAATPPRVLAADDQQHILEALELLLKPQGYRVDGVRSPQLAREVLTGASYDAALIDLNYTRDTTSGGEGLDLLSELVALDSTLPVIVMTAWGNVDLAVEAMRRGARDFIQKPWENERLLSILRTQVELHRALQQAERLAAENRLLGAEGRKEFIATAPSMLPVLQAITRIAPSDANVLVSGEHGTGKEVAAQTIHALSLRSSRPMIAVNTGGLAEGVFESELFGHVKGAFTDARSDRIGRFELADGGTIFLDEIGNVPLRQQAKLLRVIESGDSQARERYRRKLPANWQHSPRHLPTFCPKPMLTEAWKLPPIGSPTNSVPTIRALFLASIRKAILAEDRLRLGLNLGLDAQLGQYVPIPCRVSTAVSNSLIRYNCLFAAT
jgi:DNA-binding NtrC family response regulator